MNSVQYNNLFLLSFKDLKNLMTQYKIPYHSYYNKDDMCQAIYYYKNNSFLYNLDINVDMNNFDKEEVILNNYNILIDKIINENCDPSISNNYVICSACRYGDWERITYLLSDSRVDPSVNNNFAIRFACENSHSEVVELLLRDSRVDPTVNNNEPLRRAKLHSDNKILKILNLN